MERSRPVSGISGGEERRAEPPRAPAATPALNRASEEHRAYLSGREVLARHSVLRGLVILALVAFAATIWHVGFSRAFFHGWWRQW